MGTTDRTIDAAEATRRAVAAFMHHANTSEFVAYTRLMAERRVAAAYDLAARVLEPHHPDLAARMRVNASTELTDDPVDLAAYGQVRLEEETPQTGEGGAILRALGESMREWHEVSVRTALSAPCLGTLFTSLLDDAASRGDDVSAELVPGVSLSDLSAWLTRHGVRAVDCLEAAGIRLPAEDHIPQPD